MNLILKSGLQAAGLAFVAAALMVAAGVFGFAGVSCNICAR